MSTAMIVCRLFRDLLLVLCFGTATSISALAEQPFAPEIIPNLPHTQAIGTVAFSPDARFALSGADDSLIKLWDVSSRRLIRTLHGHKDKLSQAMFTAGGNEIISVGWDGALLHWDARTGKIRRALQVERHGLLSLALSPSQNVVAVGSTERNFTTWDLNTGERLSNLVGHTGWVYSVAYSPDGRRIVSGSEDKSIKLWDAESARLLRTLTGHTNSVKAVLFSPDGRRVLSGSSDGTLRLWNAETGELLRTYKGHTDGVLAVAFSPDGKLAYSSSSDSTIRMWNVSTGGMLRYWPIEDVKAMSVSIDGSSLILGTWANKINVLDLAKGEISKIIEGNSNPVQAVASTTNGAYSLSGSNDGKLRIWDALTGKLLRSLQRGNSLGVKSIAVSLDGTKVAVGSHNFHINIWDLTTGHIERVLEGHTLSVNSVAFSPDGKFLVSAGEDKKAIVWDVAKGTSTQTAFTHSGYVYCAIFSPDSRKIVTASSDSPINVWDVKTGALERSFPTSSRTIKSLALAPDGSRLASAGWDDVFSLWDLRTGQRLRTVAPGGWIGSIAFSPDGNQIATGGRDHTVRLWNSSTGELIKTFQGHSSEITSVTFSPDGLRLLSGALDSTVRFWDLRTLRELALLSVNPRDDWIAITPQGFFNSSRGASDLLSIVQGQDVISIDQVRLSLFHPDLVREALAGDPHGEVLRASKVTGLDKVLASAPAPKVTILSPPNDSYSESERTAVTVRVEDRGAGIGRVEWRLNGITVATTAVDSSDGSARVVEQEIALDLGENTIQVAAFNRSNLVASEPGSTTVGFMSADDATTPKLHVLAIGINKYRDPGWQSHSNAFSQFAPLSLAVKDAKSVGANLARAGQGLYAAVNVTYALDEDAALGNLERIVDQMGKDIDLRDTFILFAAAHGTSETGRFFLIPQDYESGLNHLPQRAISQERLQDWLVNRIKAKKVLILLDTCESGAVIGGYSRSRVDTAASDSAIGRLHEATGRPVLTAAATGQFAHEGLIADSGERHGVFTWAFLDALRKGDTNNDGLLEVSEIVRHVQKLVPELAARFAGVARATAAVPEPILGQQNARFGSLGEDFILAKVLP